MVQFRSTEREILFKVVYYGPALGGKTTNLEALHEITDPESKTQLTSLKTSEDRTLFFDFLPFELGEIEGYRIRIQLYTVPGQVQYNTTRKVVLAGADGIVFVADSSPDRLRENFTAWENMKANLLANRMALETLGVVIQANKRDLPESAPVDQILHTMRAEGTPVTEASALTGEGVIATFQLLIQTVLRGFAQRFKLVQKNASPSALDEGVARVFAPYADRRRGGAPPSEESVFSAQIPLAQPLSETEQLEAALQSTTRLAEQYQETERLSRLYRDRLREMTTLNEVGAAMAGAGSTAGALELVGPRVREIRPRWTVSLFLSEEGAPRLLVRDPAGEDPLLQAGLASGVLQGSRGKLDRLQERLGERGVVPDPPLGEAAVIPLGPPGTPRAHLVVYAPEGHALGIEDTRFLGLLERLVSPRLMAMDLLAEIQAANERLELRVVERTAELTDALERLKELDQLKRAFLNSVSHEMRTPLTNVRSYADLLLRYPDQIAARGPEYLQVISEESQRLEALIADLLSYTRVKEPARGEPCDLAEVLSEMVETLKPRADAKYIQVQVQKEHPKVVVPVNREDAQMLVRQILDNAIKYSPDGVRVKVFLLEDPRKVIFAVRDFGAGFPKEQRERLMEPLPEGGKGVAYFKKPGLGLGMFLVREVLAKYGGGLHIEAMEPGSNVVVEIPKPGAPPPEPAG